MSNTNRSSSVLAKLLLGIPRSGLFGIAAVASSVAAASVDATTINFSVPNYSGTGASTLDPGTTWNTIAVDGTTSGDKASDGSTPTNITLTDTATGVYSNGPTPVDGLFQPYEYANTSITETLNNVTPGVYDLYLYGINAAFYNGTSTQFTATGDGSGGTGTSGAVVTSRNSAVLNDTDSPVLGANYVILPVTVGLGGSSIAVSYAGVGTEGDFNGLQLVAVPEPATCSLIGLGAAFFLARRPRRRSV